MVQRAVCLATHTHTHTSLASSVSPPPPPPPPPPRPSFRRRPGSFGHRHTRREPNPARNLGGHTAPNSVDRDATHTPHCAAASASASAATVTRPTTAVPASHCGVLAVLPQTRYTVNARQASFPTHADKAQPARCWNWASLGPRPPKRCSAGDQPKLPAPSLASRSQLSLSPSTSLPVSLYPTFPLSTCAS